jgi:hypothetical protein
MWVWALLATSSIKASILLAKARSFAGQLGDNCIVFENFTASIGDLMVANWVVASKIQYS